MTPRPHEANPAPTVPAPSDAVPGATVANGDASAPAPTQDVRGPQNGTHGLGERLATIREGLEAASDYPGPATLEMSEANVAPLLAAAEAVVALHYEDIFRGHLSNGCKVCGGDYPCPTVRSLTDALGDQR